MADDIMTRLQCAYHKGEGDEPPCEQCTFCAARAEIDRLRAERDDWELEAHKWQAKCEEARHG